MSLGVLGVFLRALVFTGVIPPVRLGCKDVFTLSVFFTDGVDLAWVIPQICDWLVDNPVVLVYRYYNTDFWIC